MADWDRPTKKRKKKDPAKMDHEHGRQVFTIIQSTIIYKTKYKKIYERKKGKEGKRKKWGRIYMDITRIAISPFVGIN